jgi:hypothetical protein
MTTLVALHGSAPGYTRPLTLLRTRILIHWREFRPTLVRDLERSGEFDTVVENLETTVLEKRMGLMEQGMSLERADELLQPMWMIADTDD